MKTLLLFFLFTVTLLPAVSITLEWDPSAGATKYHLYEYFSSEPVKIGESVFSKMDVLDVPPGQHIYSVTAVNDVGESGYSNQVTAEIIVIEVESSRDLLTWTPKHRLEELVEQKKFYRVRFETP